MITQFIWASLLIFKKLFICLSLALIKILDDDTINIKDLIFLLSGPDRQTQTTVYTHEAENSTDFGKKIISWFINI